MAANEWRLFAESTRQRPRSDVVGVSYTVRDLRIWLSRLNPDLQIFSSSNNQAGIAFHHHALVDPCQDYVSFSHVERVAACQLGAHLRIAGGRVR
jgi:hypothetical protein